MPYTPTTPTLLLASNLASTLLTNWQGSSSPPGPSDGVAWGPFTRFGDADDPNLKLVGRQVEFFPTEDYEWEFHSRDRDKYVHDVYALVVERYTAAGDVTRDWWAARVDFVHTFVVQGLRYGHHGIAPFNANLYSAPDRPSRVQICDVEKLIGANKLFYALVELHYWELVNPPS